MKALMRVSFGMVLAFGLVAGLGCSQNAGKCCGQCKTGNVCGASCTKPCCAKKDGKCPTNCTKPCCKNKAKCPANCQKPCCKDKATCPANCQKPCCKDKNKGTNAKPSTGTGTMAPKTMGS